MRTLALSSLLALSLAGCGAMTARDCPCTQGAKAESEHAKAPELGAQRLMLSEGYSMLYLDASHIEWSELVLDVKSESEAVDKVVTAASEAGEHVRKDLERIAKDYPGVRIDLQPLPEIEKRKRAAIVKDRAKYFLPIVGHGGREFELSLLISLVNGLNHESHLAKVMADEEPDAGLKKFLLDTEKRYNDVMLRIQSLLEREYFRDPTGPARK